MSFNYCTVNDVKRWLAGVDVSEMPENLDAIIEQTWIPWAKREIDTYLGENFDSTAISEFYNGSGNNQLILNHRPITFLRKCVIRIIPSVKWIEFLRWFHINNISQLGIKVTERGGVEPVGNNKPIYTFPIGALVPSDLQVSAGNTGNFNNTDEQYEKSDLYVDCKLGILTIPPRILMLENQGVPFWNFTFLRGTDNIQVEYDYGYKDLESLPNEIRQACAQLVAAAVLENKGLFLGAGVVSLTHDGVSKSVGELLYGNYIKMYTESAKRTITAYKRITV